MIRTGQEYRESLRDGRQVFINGEQVDDVTRHPAFKPLIDVRTRVYDMAHEPDLADTMSYDSEHGRASVAYKPPVSQDDWHAKRRWVDKVLNDVGGVVSRIGDETIGALWSLYDGRELINDVDPDFGRNIEAHMQRVLRDDTFHVSANTDPKGDRSKPPQEQDPDMLLHLVRETDNGIIVRGAKYETGAAYANEALVNPTIANWGDSDLSDYALGFVVDLGNPKVKHICRTGFAGRVPVDDYPLTNRCDEVDTLLVFDDALIPWEDVLYYRHTRAAGFFRDKIHRYAGFSLMLRLQFYADLMIGAALHNVRQTGLERQQAVREKLTELAVYREAINAAVTAAIATAQESEGGLVMPNQSLLYSGRVQAARQLPAMMHLTRELCGGQICLTPDKAAFEHPGSGPWLQKFYTVNENWQADDRRKLLAFARDLLNSDYASHRLAFVLFAQSPPFAHLNAAFKSFDFDGPAELVHRVAGLSERVLGERAATPA
jgi:4-hydroxyphenylacetate 3-monooxygenase